MCIITVKLYHCNKSCFVSVHWRKACLFLGTSILECLFLQFVKICTRSASMDDASSTNGSVPTLDYPTSDDQTFELPSCQMDNIVTLKSSYACSKPVNIDRNRNWSKGLQETQLHISLLHLNWTNPPKHWTELGHEITIRNMNQQQGKTQYKGNAGIWILRMWGKSCQYTAKAINH
jgi:hypothetical protein